MEKQAVVLNQPEVFGPGTIAITAAETGRYTRFAICVQGLVAPPGSVSKWRLGSDIAAARNEACAAVEGDWIWFIDDDHAFKGDIIVRLLERNVDIVTPLCLRRQQPFLPVPCVADDFMDLTLYGRDELVEVQHAGSSGMLIRKRVLDAIEPPWFELGNGISEDVRFCEKARAAGFDIHVDMAVPLGHLTTAVVWPSWSEDEGRWMTGFDIADGANLLIEAASVPEPGE